MLLRLPIVALVLLFAGSGRADAGSGTAAARKADAAELRLLAAALEQTAGDMGRWAYTETRIIRDGQGKVKSHAIVRYNPSKPYAEQWRPIAVNGRAPTSADREKYRNQGERAGGRESRGQSGRRYSLGELLQVEQSRVATENARQIVFEIPLRTERNNRFPPEKFEVLAYVERAPAALDRITLRLRESFRSKLVIKVKSGEGALEFTSVHPAHPPTLTEIRGGGSVSVLFVKLGRQLELRRTDFRRVTPYAERFEVQIGTLKAIDF